MSPITATYTLMFIISGLATALIGWKKGIDEASRNAFKGTSEKKEAVIVKELKAGKRFFMFLLFIFGGAVGDLLTWVILSLVSSLPKG